jgi:hypothetical protein
MEGYFDQSHWLQKRLGRFTASEIHKIFIASKKKTELLGVGAQTYIRRKAAELLTLEVKEEIDYKQSEWGKAYEHEAVQAFEQAIGKKGIYYGIANPRFFELGEFLGGSPDWEIEDQEGADVKCPFNTDEHVTNLMIKSVDDFKDVRWEYYCQGQMNMLIRRWKKFHFVSYDPRIIEKRLRLKIISMYPDSEWIKEFTERSAAAIERLNEILEGLEAPSVFIAQNDP